MQKDKLISTQENDEDEEESEFEDIVRVDVVEDDMITQFMNQRTSFWDHLTKLCETKQQPYSQLKNDGMPSNYVILTTNKLTATKYKVCQEVSDRMKQIFTKQVRDGFGVEDMQFSSTLLDLVLSRRSVIVTSNSLQHRMQTREVMCTAIVSYLVQKFGYISQYHYKQQKKREHLIAEKQVQEGGLDQIDISDGADVSEDAEDNPASHFNGFARPQVLVLTSTRHHAWRIVSSLLGCFPGLERRNISRFKKFEKNFAPDSETVQYEVGGQSLLPDEVPDAFKDDIPSKKPLEWQQQFTRDQDDDFFVALSVHKRGPHAVALFTALERADVIVASPMGMRKVADEHVSSVHTVFVDSLDYILDTQFPSLKAIVQRLHRVPDMIRQNVSTMALPYQNLVQKTACQVVVFQAQESEIANALFSDSFDENEHFRLNHNGRGLVKFKVCETTYKQVHVQTLNVSGYLNITSRKTDLLATGALKFDITKHPKVNYALNKLLETVGGGTVMYCQNTFVFLRIKSALEKLKINCIYLSEDVKAEEIGKRFSAFIHGEADIMLVSESFCYQRRPKILSKFLVFCGPPQYKNVFEELTGWCDGEAWLLYDETDMVRLENIFDPQTLQKVLETRSVML